MKDTLHDGEWGGEDAGSFHVYAELIEKLQESGTTRRNMRLLKMKDRSNYCRHLTTTSSSTKGSRVGR